MLKVNCYGNSILPFLAWTFIYSVDEVSMKKTEIFVEALLQCLAIFHGARESGN